MKDRLKFEIISGNPNNCIAINGKRITSAKLWGFGYVIRHFTVSKDKIEKIIDGKDKVTFHLLGYCGTGGVFIDGVRITNNGTNEEYKKYLEKKAEQLKKLKKKYSHKRAKEYYEDGSRYIVLTEDIKEHLI